MAALVGRLWGGPGPCEDGAEGCRARGREGDVGWPRQATRAWAGEGGGEVRQLRSAGNDEGFQQRGYTQARVMQGVVEVRRGQTIRREEATRA